MDSKFEKWSELPTEMRFECVKWMRFETRMSLRLASKSDNSLIDAVPKYRFDSVHIRLVYDDVMHIDYKSRLAIVKMLPKHPRNDWHFAAEILKFGVIDKMKVEKFYENPNPRGHVARITNNFPIRVKKLSLERDNSGVVDFLLRNCVGLEEIKIPNFCDLDWVSYQSVINAKVIQIPFYTWTFLPRQIIENWIENDVETGKTLRLESRIENSLELWNLKFSTRVFSKSATELCLRTDNDSKYIKIEKNEFENDSYNYIFSVVAAGKV